MLGEYVDAAFAFYQPDLDFASRMRRHYSERAICEIVWLVASEHVYNMTNIGLNIHSDMLCDISKQKKAATLMNLHKETRL